MKTVTSQKTLFVRNLSLIIVATCLLNACDCSQHVSGIVLDNKTKQPIDSAYVQNADKKYDHTYTDNLGVFQVRSISGGFRRCPPMMVSITKNNYEIKTVKMENDSHDTIYLERIN